MTTLYLDTETYSEIPIKNGVHRYAEGVEVMLWSYAIDDDMIGELPEQVWDATEGGWMPEELEAALNDPSVTIVIQNSGFDRTVIRHATGMDIPVERIHDTMVQALSHGLPGGLDMLSGIFKLPVDTAKDKAGKALIRKFCMPQPKSTKLRRCTSATHPVEWERFKEYAKSDIRSMRALYHKMPKWNYPTKEHDLWCLDQRINDRGFKVDLDLARAAVELVAKTQVDLNVSAENLTDGDVSSLQQRDKLLGHLLDDYGIDLPDMRKATLERRVDDPELPWPVRELIMLRLEAMGTSAAKFPAILKSVSADGRLRGTMQFCGASRTRRWSGRTFQPQNLPRPDMKAEDIDLGIQAIKDGCADLLYDKPIKLASNALRGLIVADEGRKLVVADLSQIEARILPWGAGEQWKLDAFAAYDADTGPDLYRLSYAKGFGVAPGDVDKDQRQVGKVNELACGYGGSVGAWRAMGALYGFDLPEHLVKVNVEAWRAANPAIADWETGFWHRLDEGAREAILSPGRLVEVGPHCAFHKLGNWLRMRLPSGGVLCYADPAIVEDPRWAGRSAISYWGLNRYTRKWERQYTYGGKLSADWTQATARELMAANLPAIEAAGYPIILLVHDETVTEPLDEPRYTSDHLCSLLTARPWWVDEKLPLSAAGFEAYRYRKE